MRTTKWLTSGYVTRDVSWDLSPVHGGGYQRPTGTLSSRVYAIFIPEHSRASESQISWGQERHSQWLALMTPAI
jgi:hypothetical protein